MPVKIKGVPFSKLKRANLVLRSVTNRTRILMLELMDMHTSLSVLDLVRLMKIDQSTISMHLKILRQTELVISKREHRFKMYSINYPKTNQVIKSVTALVDKQNYDTNTEPDSTNPIS